MYNQNEETEFYCQRTKLQIFGENNSGGVCSASHPSELMHRSFELRRQCSKFKKKRKSGR